MDRLRHDIRFALRQMGRRPGFTAVVGLTLALGIGANVTIFSLVNGILLRPLDYPESDRLVMVWRDWTERGGPVREWWSYPDFLDVREQSTTLEDLAVWTDASSILTGVETPENLETAIVSWSLPKLLGTPPLLGRLFTEADDRPESEPVALLGYGFWQEHLGGDPGVLEHTIELDGTPFRVIGVMPTGFRFPGLGELALYHTFRFDPARQGRGNVFLRTVGRLAPGVGLEQAREELRGIGVRLAEAWPQADARTGIVLFPLKAEVVGEAAPYLLILLAAVALTLLLACANVANLMLARGTARSVELAVRASLGAGRGAIVRQLLVESLLLALLGGAAGLLLAVWGVDLLTALLGEVGEVPRLAEVRLDLTVLAAAAGLTLLTGVLFGILPALQAALRPPGGVLRRSDEELGRGDRRMRHLLVGAQVAVAMMLLAGSALLLQSFIHLRRVDTGFRSQGVLLASLGLTRNRYPDEDRLRTFQNALLERLATLPGVQDAAICSTPPLSGSNTDASFRIVGRPDPAPGEEQATWYRSVSPDYLALMGIPILAGRGLTAQDTPEGPTVAVANASFMQRFFPDEEVIGQRLEAGREITIVGVAGNVRNFRLEEEEPPAIYLAAAQVPPRFFGLVLRTGGAPEALTAGVREAVRELDPMLVPAGITSMDRRLDRAVAADRVTSVLVSLFGLLALALAAVGIYGVMSFVVGRRTREIGVRMALGADAGSVRSLIVGESLRITLAGVGVGLAGSLAAAPLLRGRLFGIGPYDAGTLAGTALVLVGVALAAAWLPARRATRVDPVAALRSG